MRRRYRSPKEKETENDVLATITLYKEGGYDWTTPDEEPVSAREMLGGLEEVKVGIIQNMEE